MKKSMIIKLFFAAVCLLGIGSAILLGCTPAKGAGDEPLIVGRSYSLQYFQLSVDAKILKSPDERGWVKVEVLGGYGIEASKGQEIFLNTGQAYYAQEIGVQ